MDCDLCEQYLAEVLQEERPRQLVDALREGSTPKKGGTPPLCQGEIPVRCYDLSSNPSYNRIRGMLCADKLSGEPELVLCANKLSSKDEVRETVVHELVHYYDYCVKGLDLRECEQNAYSEIRANREAECHPRDGFWFDWRWENCVRSNALRSTRIVHPGSGKAEACVAKVFREALADASPFPPFLHPVPAAGPADAAAAATAAAGVGPAGAAAAATAVAAGGEDCGVVPADAAAVGAAAGGPGAVAGSAPLPLSGREPP